MPGTLYLVSLPIGNLNDITLRAIQCLRKVDLIVAEDTRHTHRILSRYRIRTSFSLSLYQGVEEERVEPCLSLLREGKNLALVSDAGTPLVSDPGYPLVRAAVDAGIPVVPIPGATALVAALVASGLPTDRFVFDGAVPRKEGERSSYVATLQNERRTVIVYESPHRLLATLQAIAGALPERRIVVARELTKVHEELLRGTASELLEVLSARGDVKGEIVLLVAGSERPSRGAEASRAEEALLLLEAEGLSKTACARILTQILGLPRNEAYRLVHHA
jgi:16S rRNA (cytidine1402-2'-O)-methyltransferase